MIGRVIGTVVTTMLYGWIMMAYSPQATLITGQAAGHQFDNTDEGYLTAVYTMNFFSAIGTVITVLFIGILADIWFRPVRKFRAARLADRGRRSAADRHDRQSGLFREGRPDRDLPDPAEPVGVLDT